MAVEGSEERKRGLTGAAVLTYGTNIGVAVLSLVNVLVVARALGPSGRGSVAFLTTIANLTAQLVTFGVWQSNVNLASREPELTPRLATNSALLAALTGSLGVGVVAALVAIFPAVGGSSTAGLRWLALASVPIMVFQIYIQQLLIAHYRFSVTNGAWLLTPIVNVVVNGTLALAGSLTVGIAVASWVVGQTLQTVVLTWFVVRRLGGFGRPDAALARGMLSFGAKSHITRIFTLSNYRLDQWLMGAIAGSRQLGYYSVAVAWAEALFFLPTALATVQRPDLSRTDAADAGQRVAPVFRMTMWITLAMAIAMVVAAPLLCVVLFGADFRPSVGQLRVLTIGAFGIVALKLLGNVLVAQRRPLLETGATFLAFVVITGLDLLLIPGMNGMGASIASAIAYTVGGIAIIVVFCRFLPARVRDLVPRFADIAELAAGVRALARRGGGRTRVAS
jgi:O-antigen/teichoic acid export membrane protein